VLAKHQSNHPQHSILGEVAHSFKPDDLSA
jgi:hypothetical protein